MSRRIAWTKRGRIWALVGLLLAVGVVARARADAVARLEAGRLGRVQAAREAFASARRPLERTGPFQEYRVNLHVHSHWSHDSRGQLPAIVAAAKAAGTHVLMFTEHPASHYDFVTDGHGGLHDGVLAIPGAEMQGLLVFPRASLAEQEALEPADLVRRVRQGGGLAFLSHLEERLDWELPGLTGCEIYNTHADAKEEKQLFAALKNPLWLLQIAPLLERFPQEAFSALQDDPRLYLDRWDQLSASFPHTAVSANDAHENIGLTITVGADGTAVIADALGETLRTLDLAMVRALLPVPDDAAVGDVVFRLQLDPYENSLRHVATHVLATELSRDAIEEALAAGRSFVAFDWIADATGFDCHVAAGDVRHELGSVLPFAADLRLRAAAPLPGHWRVIRGGECIHEADGESIDLPITAPGPHRLEVSLDVAGEPHLWILGGPIHVREAAAGAGDGR